MKNEYYQKFTELKKREPKRIELGLVDDLEKVIQKTNTDYKTLLKLEDKFYKANDELKAIGKKVFEGEQDILELRNKLVKAVKDLGIDTQPAIIKKATNVAKIYDKAADKALRVAKY